MEANEVQALVATAFPDGEVRVDLDGGHYTVTVVSAAFEGVRPVARQQRVYAPLAPVIAQGTIHAVNIKALTPSERDAG
ncbi:BolA family protein [Luminiphilus syltensis]|uniref:BolA family protein n=1 Tax=Luminiphilus syltensis TaxID=1341119 RepID=UPI0002F338B8|nr:BolA/IbaG family iron-sulfur metabolism protein [Luminiphilus syltensis]